MDLVVVNFTPPIRIADYTRAIGINPKFAGACYSRALVKQEKGDRMGGAADLA
ncbi:MAG: hypothetical protein V1796_01560 [Pseudomonadota bacterium]